MQSLQAPWLNRTVAAWEATADNLGFEPNKTVSSFSINYRSIDNESVSKLQLQLSKYPQSTNMPNTQTTVQLHSRENW